MSFSRRPIFCVEIAGVSTVIVVKKNDFSVHPVVNFADISQTVFVTMFLHEKIT